MQTEYEAKFLNIDKDEMRARLKKAGAKLIRSEFLQKRIPFYLPDKKEKHSWIRVRDEGDKVTLSFKSFHGEKIDDQKEISVTVNSFEDTVAILKAIGCHAKSYQETKRELWMLDGAEITIDTWPFLEPFIEIEGKSEKEVKVVSKKLGFDYSQAIFGGVGSVYKMKYGISPDEVNKIPKIVFDMENPFL